MKLPAKAGALIALALLFAANGLGQMQKANYDAVADSSVVPVSADSASAKICSCELLKIASNPAQAQWVVVYAEKSAHRKKSDVRLLKYYLRKERKRITEGITYRVFRNLNLTTSLPCQELFRIMQNDRHYLVLYSIIDLDVLTQVARR